INVTPALTISGATVPLANVNLPPHGSSVLELAKDTVPTAVATMWQENEVGGISIFHDGAAGALNTGGWIEDDSPGYSTTMTFQDPTIGRGHLLSTQILIGAANKILNVDAPLIISSQLVLRDIGDQPLDFHGKLVFSNGGSLATATIPLTHMSPGDIQHIDLNVLKATTGIPAVYVSASISLEYSGKNGSLMGRVYGASADRAYGFYWAL